MADGCNSHPWIWQSVIHHHHGGSGTTVQKTEGWTEVLILISTGKKQLRKKRKNAEKIPQNAKRPMWGQLKNLTHHMEQIIKQQGGSKSLTTMFVAMMAFLSCQVGLWGNLLDLIPRSTFSTPAVWTGESIPGFTKWYSNDGRFSDKAITTFHSTGFNYTWYREVYLSIHWSPINRLVV